MRVRILSESLASARKKYGETSVDILKPYDPTPTYKYLEWLCFHSIEKNEGRFGYLKDMLIKFNKIHNNLEKKDIWQYNFTELEDIINKYVSKKEAEDLLRKIPEGAEKIFENDKAAVIRVDTFGASCYYGYGKFCIADTNGPHHWDDFMKRHFKFFYIIDKDDIKHPQVIQVQPGITELDRKPDLTGWNKYNRHINAYEILDPLDIKKEIFDIYSNSHDITTLQEILLSAATAGDLKK